MQDHGQKERWTNTMKGMKEKDPEILDEIGVKEIVNFLYELQKAQIKKEGVK